MNRIHLITVILGMALLLFINSLARADSWEFPAIVSKQKFLHGSVSTVVTRDATTNQKYPDYRLEVFNGDTRVALIPGVSFEQLFASSDNTIFVGVSNSGVPDTAVVIFTAKGEIRFLANHSLASFEYCEKSVSIKREWYDSKNPSVKFVLTGPVANQGIFIRDCKGREIELVSTIQKAIGKAGARK